MKKAIKRLSFSCCGRLCRLGHLLTGSAANGVYNTTCALTIQRLAFDQVIAQLDRKRTEAVNVFYLWRERETLLRQEVKQHMQIVGLADLHLVFSKYCLQALFNRLLSMKAHHFIVYLGIAHKLAKRSKVPIG
jgi:hypothetical protein